MGVEVSAGGDGAGGEAVLAREKLAELRARREKARQAPVTHADRLWSRFRVDPQVLREIGELAVAGAKATDMDVLRAALLQRRGKVAVSLNRESIDAV